MKSREELSAIRERARAALAVRESGQGPRVVVAMGTCGIAAGAREVMAALLDELSERGLDHVTVSQTGCKGLCDAEPMLEVHCPDSPVITYGRVNPDVVRRIVGEHIVGSQVIGDYVVATRTE